MALERNTRQRAAILKALEGAHHPVDPVELLAVAQRDVPQMGIATVYRAIRDLVDEGRLATVELPGTSPRYELAGRAHHHHFHCRSCGKVFEVDGCPGDLAHLTPKGFALEAHEVVLYGACAGCARVASRAARRSARPSTAR